MNYNKKILTIIPARYASIRFPGKVLADIGGKPMVQHTYERVCQSKEVDRVVVATDDERIAIALEAFGTPTLMTRDTHESGTDRCAEVAGMGDFEAFEIIVNVQADEPGIHPEQIDQMIQILKKDTHKSIATLCRKISDQKELFSPNVVKCVMNNEHNALYFSRNAIPYLRDVPLGNWLESATFLQHVGLYAYRKNTLQKIAQLPVGKLEALEKLEQLRWLEAGIAIGVGITDYENVGIDTPSDLAAYLKK